MAKQSLIQREEKREKLVAKFAKKYAELKAIAADAKKSDEERYLARLELQPDESARLLTQLTGFFDIVEQMRAVDTTGITPLAHPVDTIQPVALRLRDDLASEPNDREANQKSAPAVERGLFLVPKVIE